MRLRRPARIFAPLALLAALGAVYLVVHDADVGQSNSPTHAAPATKSGPTNTSKAADRKAAKGPKTYTVRPGDTLTSIAGKTGVSADQISELNPQLDPQGLQPGQKIKLRP